MQAMASQALSPSFLLTNSRRSFAFNFSTDKRNTSSPHKSRSGNLQAFAGKLRIVCSSINCQLPEARNGSESSRREVAIGLLAGSGILSSLFGIEYTTFHEH